MHRKLRRFFFSISSVRIRSISKIDSRVASSILALLSAYHECLVTSKLITSQVVKWLLLQISVGVDRLSHGKCIKIEYIFKIYIFLKQFKLGNRNNKIVFYAASLRTLSKCKRLPCLVGRGEPIKRDISIKSKIVSTKTGAFCVKGYVLQSVRLKA